MKILYFFALISIIFDRYMVLSEPGYEQRFSMVILVVGFSIETAKIIYKWTKEN